MTGHTVYLKDTEENQSPLYTKEFFDYSKNTSAQFEAYISGQNYWNKPLSRLDIHGVYYIGSGSQYEGQSGGISGILLVHHEPGTVKEEFAPLDIKLDQLLQTEITNLGQILNVRLTQDSECPPVDMREFGIENSAGEIASLYINEKKQFRFFSHHIGRPILDMEGEREENKWFTITRLNQSATSGFDSRELKSSMNPIADNDTKKYRLIFWDLTKRCMLYVYKAPANLGDVGEFYENLELIAKTVTNKGFDLAADVTLGFGTYFIRLRIIEDGCTKFNLDLREIGTNSGEIGFEFENPFSNTIIMPITGDGPPTGETGTTGSTGSTGVTTR